MLENEKMKRDIMFILLFGTIFRKLYWDHVQGQKEVERKESDGLVRSCKSEEEMKGENLLMHEARTRSQNYFF